VTEHTLGQAHDRVTPTALLHAAKKMLAVHNGKIPVDDTDSLTFKTFHAVDDFLAERIRLTARTWAPKAKMAFSGKSNIREALRPAPFSDSIRKFVTTSSLTAVPSGINPLELMDHAVKVTSLGEGGISSDRAIPLDARMTHATHFGALDPIRTPESGSAGVDIRATIAAHRDDRGNFYTAMKDVKTGKQVFMRAGDLVKNVVAFPGQNLKGSVKAFVNGKIEEVPGSRVTHEMLHLSHQYSPATSLIPMIHNIQGNRAIMGSKMGTQALPLLDRETPYVQVKSHLPGEVSFEKVYGHLTVPTSPVNGTVEKIQDGYIYIRPHGEKKAEDRPVIEQKKLGPHTFNLEMLRHQFEDAPGMLTTRSGNWDYGHLPGYTGPDGDSLDFFVGDHHDGHIFSFDKQRNDDGKGWKTTDTKFVVGVTPEQKAEFRRRQAVYNSGPAPMRHTNIREYKDWGHLQRHIDEHFKNEKSAAAKDDGLIKVPYETNFPFPSKTYLHHDIQVKPGQTVQQGQRLGDSNFTRNGTLALGKNLLVGYMAYHGLNSNDAVVISESCSKKLTSEHMYREIYPLVTNRALARQAQILLRHQVHAAAVREA
jgi:DNA-directed RNA polymerase beta subunit